MQHDLDRMLQHRRRRRRIVAIIVATMLAALVVVVMRSCVDQFNEPYNKAYQPLDEERQKAVEKKR
jgi:predicted PurR-regulated permease PerM